MKKIFLVSCLALSSLSVASEYGFGEPPFNPQEREASFIVLKEKTNYLLYRLKSADYREYESLKQKVSTKEDFCQNLVAVAKESMTYQDCLNEYEAFLTQANPLLDALEKEKQDVLNKIAEQERVKAEIEKTKLDEQAKYEIARQQMIETDTKNYPIKLKEALALSIKKGHAWNILTGSTCNDVWDANSSDTPEHIKKLVSQCAKDLPVLFVEEIKKPTFISQNCSHYAIKKGWANAPLDMTHNPLGTNKNSPVLFSGSITNGNNSEFLIFNNGINAVISIDKTSTIFNKEKIAVNGSISGYGFKKGSQKVKLVSGVETTISVIRASCLQPNLY